jgi:hypothetical protein
MGIVGSIGSIQDLPLFMLQQDDSRFGKRSGIRSIVSWQPHVQPVLEKFIDQVLQLGQFLQHGIGPCSWMASAS